MTPVMAAPTTLLILNYHRVGTPTVDARYRGMFVTPAHLRFHVRLLRHWGFAIVPLREAWTCGAAKVACLTFDDGYQDNLTLGFPVLQEEGVHPTLFVITDDVGKTQHRWTEAGETARADLLSWEELQFLHDHGWEIASHGTEHLHLGRLPQERQQEILLQSRLTLESKLQTPVMSFAFPYGDFTEETVAALPAAGYRYGCTTQSGYNTEASPLGTLHRVPVCGYRWVHYLQTYLRLKKVL